MPPSGQLDATSTPPTARTIATSPSRIRWTRVRLSIGAPARGASSVCSGSVSVDGDRAERERRQQRACPQQRRGVDRLWHHVSKDGVLVVDGRDQAVVEVLGADAAPGVEVRQAGGDEGAVALGRIGRVWSRDRGGRYGEDRR